MKKYYVKPELQASEVEAESLICVSINEQPADESTVLSKGKDAPAEEVEYGNLW